MDKVRKSFSNQDLLYLISLSFYGHRNGEFACSRARIIHKQNTADCDVLECINWQG